MQSQFSMRAARGNVRNGTHKLVEYDAELDRKMMTSSWNFVAQFSTGKYFDTTRRNCISRKLFVIALSK